MWSIERSRGSFSTQVKHRGNDTRWGHTVATCEFGANVLDPDWHMAKGPTGCRWAARACLHAFAGKEHFVWF